jgi:hypothetical protein
MVRGENDHGVFADARLLERLQDASQISVGFLDGHELIG